LGTLTNLTLIFERYQEIEIMPEILGEKYENKKRKRK